MLNQQSMYTLYIRIFLVCLCCYAAARPAAAQQRYATNVFDFKPAPGQFTNSGLATPDAATGVLGASDWGMVSLGGFGGYIVVGFNGPVVNDPQNPYGVDFTISGNAFSNWSEPGAVMVMKDENKNGLPDDTWYELAGSEYYFSRSKPVAVTYFNPNYTVGRDVPWEIEGGRNGAIRTNEFYHQQYYPQPDIFKNVGATQERYTGTLINSLVNRSNPTYITSGSLAFGYADNKGNNPTPHVPTNPYQDDDRGASSDGFDIAWAVDANGNSVVLDQIDFVKIYNAAQEDAGWLGESSTEIETIAVTTPDPSWEPTDYYLHVIGSAPLQVVQGKQHTFEGLLFKNGIPQTGTAHWSVSDPAVGNIDQNGVFTASATGTTVVEFYSDENVPPATVTVAVINLVGLELLTNTPTLFTGERGYVHTEGVDNREEPYNHFAYDTYTYQVSNAAVLTISPTGVVTALAPGTATITAVSQSDNNVTGTIEITVTDTPIPTASTDNVQYAFELGKARINLDTLISLDGDGQYSYTIQGIDKAEVTNAEIVGGHYLNLSFAESKPGTANLTLGVMAYGRTRELPLRVTITPPATVSKGKQIVFVNGGQFQSLNGNIQVYDPETNTTEKLADLDAANSVQDVEALGRYVYISADYYILKYDMATGAEVTRRYTQDRSQTEADGLGKDANGLNHSMTLYKNWLITTRQNSAAAPDDGYNVRIYNKQDLSLVKKIPVSTQAADVVVVGDSAFVLLNGGFQANAGKLAIIDLVNLERKEEYDFGTEGSGIMQTFVQGDNLYVLAQSKLLKYSIREHTHEAYDLPIGHSDASSSPFGVGIIDGMLYSKLMDESWNKGFGRINLEDATIDKLDVFGMSTDPEIVDNGYMLMASAYDREAERFYFTFGLWWGWGIGLIYDKEGNKVGSFENVQDSPERMVVSYGVTNSSPYNAALLKTVDAPRDRETGIALSEYFGDDDNESLIYTWSTPDNSAIPSWITLKDGVLTASPAADAVLDTVMITITANDQYYDDPAVQTIEVIVRERIITGLPQEPVVQTLYPNPVKDVLNVKVTVLPAALYITDTRGNRVAEHVMTETADATVDLRALPTGLYVLTLRQGANVVRTKIVKE